MVKAITWFTKVMNLVFKKDIHNNVPLTFAPSLQHVNLMLDIIK